MAISLKNLPWDIYEMFIDFYPLNEGIPSKLYKSLRLVNRDFYRFISKRRSSLIFNDPNITARVFYDLILKSTGNKTGSLDCKSATRVKQFAIMKNIGMVNATNFNKLIVPFRGLLQLDLQGFNKGLGEQGLNKILIGCARTL